MSTPAPAPHYPRVLIKLSGEAMRGHTDFGIDPPTVAGIAAEIGKLHGIGCQVAMVIGAGNLFRGRELTVAGLDRVTADQMGMLATVMNCLALQSALEQHGLSARVMSALRMYDVCEDFIRRRAIRHLEKGRIVLSAAGIGNPFFTTDTAAALRAVEIEATLLIKATKVDGVYSGNPVLDRSAERIDYLSYDEFLQRKLEVMDATAIVLCRDNHVPLRVMNMHAPQALLRAVCGDPEGTLIAAKRDAA